jgi:hypothetical protein
MLPENRELSLLSPANTTIAMKMEFTSAFAVALIFSTHRLNLILELGGQVSGNLLQKKMLKPKQTVVYSWCVLRCFAPAVMLI